MVQITPVEWDACLANRTLKLAFVGMSNAGKSHHSRVIRDECNFMWYEVDAAIQQDLGFSGMGEISKWLRQPYTEGFKQRQQRYLESEARSTKVNLEMGGKNLVFDTAGSCIYLNQEILNWLRNEMIVVNIDVEEEDIEQVTQRYIRGIKEIVWGDFFKKKEGETNEDALRRCFPILLQDRIRRYRELAHLTIPSMKLHNKSGVEKLEVIKSYL